MTPQDGECTDQLRAVRPRADDPTRLEGGAFHPRYIQWLCRHTWAERHPLHEFLNEAGRLDRVVDEQGFFDRKKVTQALGRSGVRYWEIGGAIPTPARLPTLAKLVRVGVKELRTVVEQELAVREQYDAMLGMCRWLPYKLLTYDEIVAGAPCPACGRPWTGPYKETKAARRRWDESHTECKAGTTSITGGPQHCRRCCGMPPTNPDVLVRLGRMVAEEAARAEKERRAEAAQSPAARRAAAAAAAAAEASRRAAEIERLEARLARLRAARGDAPA